MDKLVQLLKKENGRKLVKEFGKFYIYISKKDHPYLRSKLKVSSNWAEQIIENKISMEQIIREYVETITYYECLHKLTVEGVFNDLIIFEKYSIYYHADCRDYIRDRINFNVDTKKFIMRMTGSFVEIYVIKDKNAYAVEVNVVDSISDDERDNYNYRVDLNDFICLITLKQIDNISDFDLKDYFKNHGDKNTYKTDYEIQQLIKQKDLLRRKIVKYKNKGHINTNKYEELCNADKQLDEELKKYNIQAFRNDGHDFNHNCQESIGTVSTNNIKRDGKIAIRYGCGFKTSKRKKGKIIRREQVKLFKYESNVNVFNSQPYMDCSYMALRNRSPLECCSFEWDASVPFIVVDNGVKKLACIRNEHSWLSDTKSDIYLIDENNVLEIIKTNTYYRYFKNPHKKISIEEYCDLLHERFNSESSECLDLLKYIADSSCVDSDYKNCIDYLKDRKFQFESHDRDLKNWPGDIGLLIKNETENLRKQIKNQGLFSSLPFVISNDKDLAWFVCSFHNYEEYTYDDVFIRYIYVMDKYGHIKRTKVWFDYHYNNNLDNTPLIETDQEYLELLQLELENFSKDSMLNLIEKAEGNTLLPVYKVIMSNLIGQLSLEMKSSD